MRQYDIALYNSIKTLDSDLSFWVIEEALSNQGMTIKSLVSLYSRVPEGLRTLKGYGLRRGNVEMLSEVKQSELLSTLPQTLAKGDQVSLQPVNDPGLMAACVHIKQAYNQQAFDVRVSKLKQARRELESDLFYR